MADKLVADNLRVVVLSGNPTQIGLSHGQQLAGEIRYLVDRLHHHVFRRVDPIRRAGLQVITRGFALAMNRHIPPYLRQEMQAVALGSNVPYSDLLLFNCLDDILNILRRLAPRSPFLGCSSFALFGERSMRGVIHGRNLDYHFRGTPLDDGGAVARLLAKSQLLFVYRPVGGAAFLSLGWPGQIGTTTALNWEGISLGNLTSYLRGTTPNGVPSTILYRRILQQASTIQEVEKLIRSARRTIGNNLMVGSGREGLAALFEITRDSVIEVPHENGLLVATNHFVSPILAHRQRPTPIPHSIARRQRLLALCNGYGVRPEQALNFLADTVCVESGQARNPFARVANEGTALSVLFQPSEMVVRVAMRREPPVSGGGFTEIDAAALLSD